MNGHMSQSRGAAWAFKLFIWYVLSGLGIVGGLWLCKNTSPILAVGPLTAGLYVLMAMVADDLVPGASPTATGFMKLTTALVFFEWALIALLSLKTDTPI